MAEEFEERMEKGGGRMKYAIAAKKESDDYVWQLFEVATSQVINTYFFEDDALEDAEFYECGGGFDGFTPAFILQDVTGYVKNVNENFIRFFE